MKNTTPALVFFTLMYAFLYFFTLNCNYVEGDDAATVLYHLCGRNPEVQQPYAAYNSGLDFVIKHSGLTTEPRLRSFAVLLSYFSGWLSVCFLVLLLERLARQFVPEFLKRALFYAMLPIIIPDFIFHSLIVNASNISFVLLLASLLVFGQYLEKRRNPYLLLSMVMFGLCLPFRWTTGIAVPLYVGIYGLYFPFWKDFRNHWQPLLKIILSNVAGLAFGIGMIAVSGYNWHAIVQTVSGTTNYLEQSEVSAMALFASGSAFLTPALLVLLVCGICGLWTTFQSKKDRVLGLAFFLACSASPFVMLGFYPMYKYSMSLIPVLLLLLLQGFAFVSDRKLLVALVAVLVFAPWFIGLEITADGTFCGPGFELNIHKQTAPARAERNPDTRVKIQSVKPVLNAGFYLPMPEGPRPLYGYAYVLFGGGWFNQVELFTRERERIFDYLQKHRSAFYFQDRMASYFSCDLYRYGYHTYGAYHQGDFGPERLFTKGSDSLTIHVVPAASKAEWIGVFFDSAKHPVIFRSTYSNDILKLQSEKRDGVRLIGPFTALKE